MDFDIDPAVVLRVLQERAKEDQVLGLHIENAVLTAALMMQNSEKEESVNDD